MSFNCTNIALVIKHNGILYYFYTWTSDEYFYEKKSFCVNFNGTVLYVPCIPVDNETLKNYSHTIRVNFNNTLYSFLGANKSLSEHQAGFSDMFTITTYGPENGGEGTYTNSITMKITTAQRYGMRYKYYIRQLTDTEANKLGYLSDSDTMNMGNIQYWGTTTFGGTQHLSNDYNNEKYSIELVNSEQTAELIGGTYTHSWVDEVSHDSSRAAISYNTSNIAVYRMTSEIFSGYTDIIINYKNGTKTASGLYTVYHNGVKQTVSDNSGLNISINYSKL